MIIKMKTHAILTPAVALCSALWFTAVPSPIVESAPQPAPAAGPGNVIVAVTTFLDALDEGRMAEVADILSGEYGKGTYGFETSKGERDIVRLEAGSTPNLFDVAADGRALGANDAQSFCRLLEDGVAPTKERTVRTSIRSIRADCPSGDCSWAVVEFDRLYAVGGEDKTRVPMHATVLLRYAADAKPNFRIFHWNASVSGEPVALSKAAGGDRGARAPR